MKEKQKNLLKIIIICICLVSTLAIVILPKIVEAITTTIDESRISIGNDYPEQLGYDVFYNSNVYCCELNQTAGDSSYNVVAKITIKPNFVEVEDVSGVTTYSKIGEQYSKNGNPVEEQEKPSVDEILMVGRKISNTMATENVGDSGFDNANQIAFWAILAQNVEKETIRNTFHILQNNEIASISVNDEGRYIEATGSYRHGGDKADGRKAYEKYTDETWNTSVTYYVFKSTSEKQSFIYITDTTTGIDLQFRLKKIDADTSEGLGGIEFSTTSGNAYLNEITRTTTADGYTSAIMLPVSNEEIAGKSEYEVTFKLSEILPDVYKNIYDGIEESEITLVFDINTKQIISLVPEDEYFSFEGENTIVVKNYKKNSVEVIKVDEGGSPVEELQNVSFDTTITKEGNEGVSTKKITSGEKLSFEDGNGTYIVKMKEDASTVPTIYEPITEDIEFQVVITDEGATVNSSNDNIIIEQNEETGVWQVKVKNAKKTPKIKITKIGVDENNVEETLVGIKYDLEFYKYSKSEEGEIIKDTVPSMSAQEYRSGDESITLKMNDLMGDVDGDGKVTSADLRLLQRHTINLEKIDESRLKFADLDGDGEINAADTRIMLRIIAGLETVAEATNDYICIVKEDATSLPKSYEGLIDEQIEVKFTIDESGVIEKVEEFPTNYVQIRVDTDTNTLEIIVKNYVKEEAELKFIKVDEKGQPLEGAQFNVVLSTSNSIENKIIEELTTNITSENGEAKVTFNSTQIAKIAEITATPGSEQEIYVLAKEIKVPSGYKNISEDGGYVTIGKLKYELATQSLEKITLTEAESGFSIVNNSFEIKNNKDEDKLRLIIRKKDLSGTKSLEGGLFKVVIKQQGKEPIEETKGAVNGVIYGPVEVSSNATVTITETKAIENCEQPPTEPITVAIGETGKNIVATPNAGKWLVTETTGTNTVDITLKNQPDEDFDTPKLKIVKTDKNGTKILSEAGFNLYVAKAENPTENDKNLSTVNGETVAEELPIGEYLVKITETTPPENYKGLDKEIVFSYFTDKYGNINKINYYDVNGTIITREVTKADSIEIITGVKIVIDSTQKLISVYVKNEGKIENFKIEAQKVDEHGNAIDGVEMNINETAYISSNGGYFYNGDTKFDSKTYSAAENHSVSFNFTEVSAPAGYNQINGTHTIDLNYSKDSKKWTWTNQDGLDNHFEIKLVGNIIMIIIKNTSEDDLMYKSYLQLNKVDGEILENKESVINNGDYAQIKNLYKIIGEADFTVTLCKKDGTDLTGGNIVKTGSTTNGVLELKFDSLETETISKEEVVVVKVKETIAPAEYSIIPDEISLGEFKYYYNSDLETGYLLAQEDNNEKYFQKTQESYIVQIKNYKEFIAPKIQIKKLGEEDVLLSDVAFYVCATQGTQALFEGTYKTENGYINFDNIEVKNYDPIKLIVIEKETNPRYELRTDKIELEYTYDSEAKVWKWEYDENTITVKVNGDIEKIEDSLENEFIIGIENKFETSKLRIIKTDASKSNAPLKDIEFTVLLGEKTYSLKTDEEGLTELDLNTIIPGTYTIKITENNNNGYRPTGIILEGTITIASNGSVANYSITNKAEELKKIDVTNGIELSIENYPIQGELELIKKDTQGNPLEKAKFYLRVSGQGFEDKKLFTDVTNAEGKVIVKFNANEIRDFAAAGEVTIYATEVISPETFAENTEGEVCVGTFKCVYDAANKSYDVIKTNGEDAIITNEKVTNFSIAAYKENENGEKIEGSTFDIKAEQENGETLYYNANVETDTKITIEPKKLTEKVKVTIKENMIDSTYYKVTDELVINFEYNGTKWVESDNNVETGVFVYKHDGTAWRDKTTEITGEQATEYNLREVEFQFHLRDEKLEIPTLEILKVDNEGNNIISDSAKFTVTVINDAINFNIEEDLSTDQGKKVLQLTELVGMNNIKNGEYTFIVKEILAPSGYKKNNNPIVAKFYLTFNKHGKIEKYEESMLNGAEIQLAEATNTIRLIVENEKESATQELKIRKGAIEKDQNEKYQVGNKLKGAKFNLYIFEGETTLVRTINEKNTTNVNGELIVKINETLHEGTYYLYLEEVEIPDGYKTVKTEHKYINGQNLSVIDIGKFNVNSSGEILFTEENNYCWFFNGDKPLGEALKENGCATVVNTNTVWIPNERDDSNSNVLNLNIHKTKHDETTILQGVEFTATFTQNEEILSIQTKTTDAEGNIEFNKVKPKNTSEDVVVTLDENEDTLPDGVFKVNGIKAIYRYKDNKWEIWHAEYQSNRGDYIYSTYTIDAEEDVFNADEGFSTTDKFNTMNLDQETSTLNIRDFIGFEKLIINKEDYASKEIISNVKFNVEFEGVFSVDYNGETSLGIPDYNARRSNVLTDSNGQIVFERIIIPTNINEVKIKLTEETPAGYKTMDPIVITLTREGENWNKKVQRAEIDTDDDSWTITNKQEPREINDTDITIDEKSNLNINIHNIPIMNLGGLVWLDGQTGLKPVQSYNGIMDENEKRLGKIKVYLCKEDATGNTEKVAETTTLETGAYLFEGVEADPNYKYYVVFEYEGVNYEPTYYMKNTGANSNVVDSSYNDASKAKDIESERNELAMEMRTIENGTTVTRRGTEDSKLNCLSAKTATSGIMEYKYDNSKSTLITTNGESNLEQYKMWAVSDAYLVDMSRWKDTWTEDNKPNYDSYALNINFGLVKRGLDLSLGTDLDDVRVSVNGKMTEYDYSNFSAIDVPENFAEAQTYTDSDKYSLSLYYEDGQYDETSPLDIKATYRVVLNNQGTTEATVDQIKYSYDETYFTGIENVKCEKYGSNDMCNAIVEGNNIINLDNCKLKESEQWILYITLNANVSKIKELGTNASQVMNIAEITKYSNTNGIVDIDSAPGNYNGNNYEDDTDISRGLEISWKNSTSNPPGEENPEDKYTHRIISGIVWDDTTNVDNKEDGKYDKDTNDKLIENVKVELIRLGMEDIPTGEEVNEPFVRTANGIGKIVAETKTNAEGKYTFRNFVAGEYIVRFTYGNEGDYAKYSGADYQSTIDSHYQDTWYDSNNYSTNSSVARDSEPQRLRVMAYTQYVDNAKAIALAATNSNTTTMYAETSKINVLPGVDENTLNSLANSNRITGTSIVAGAKVEEEVLFERTHINFGLKKRPETRIILRKHITGIAIQSSGIGATPIINATIDYGTALDEGKSISQSNIKGVKDGLTTMVSSVAERGYWKVETDLQELGEGAKLSIKYNYGIINNSDPDYISKALNDLYESKTHIDVNDSYPEQLRKLATDLEGVKPGNLLGNYYYTGQIGTNDTEAELQVERMEEVINYEELAFIEENNAYFKNVDGVGDVEKIKYTSDGDEQKIKIQKDLKPEGTTDYKSVVETTNPSNFLSATKNQDSTKTIVLAKNLSASDEIAIDSYIAQITAYSTATGTRDLSITPENLGYIHSEAAEIRMDTLKWKDETTGDEYYLNPTYNPNGDGTVVEYTAYITNNLNTEYTLTKQDSGDYKCDAIGLTITQEQINNAEKMNENDEFWAERVIISKPTGDDAEFNWVATATIVAAALATIAGGIILIKKYVISK